MSSQLNDNNKSQIGSKTPWILLLIVVSIFAWYVMNDKKNEENIPKVNSQQTWQPPRSENQELKPIKKNSDVVSYHDAVAKAAQSVVNIYTTQKVTQHPYMDDPILRRFFDVPEQQNENSTNLGSGVIVSNDGYIVTNAHVVEQADEVIVALNDGRKSRAKIIGVDPESDLAVIKVEMTDLKALAFRANLIEVGDVALAIGNPFGVGQTVTQGIISATGRTGLGVNMFEDFIQTDAAINPGNSGGALVDAYGELVGINTMIFSRSGGSMGIGFAIPTAIVEQVMTALIENGRVSRGWLGIEVQSQIKDPTKLNRATGVTVMNVIKNSPAQKSGLQVGDIILSIDGKEMLDSNTLVQYVARKLPNTTLQAQVLRKNQTINIDINLAERPSQKDLISNNRNTQKNSQPDNRNYSEKGSIMTDSDKERLRQELLELFERERN